MYVYCADLYCDDCGEGIAEYLFERGADDTGDSDAYPQSAAEGESDSPNHCGCGADCHGAIDLTEYGLTEEDLRHGAPRYVGALIRETLTDHGVSYAREMMEDPDASEYQRAVHRVWREAFPAVMDAAEEDARTRGREDGVAAGTWILDGNSTEDAARALLAGLADCDPLVIWTLYRARRYRASSPMDSSRGTFSPSSVSRRTMTARTGSSRRMRTDTPRVSRMRRSAPRARC